MVLLPKEKDIVLKADDPKYKRGLVVTLKNKGGYDLYYWYDDPKKIYPAEISVDGTVVDPAGKIVHVGFHPELAGIIADHVATNPSHVRYLPQSYGVPSSQDTKRLNINRPITPPQIDQEMVVLDFDFEDNNNNNNNNGGKLSFEPYLFGLGIALLKYFTSK